jgi:hypothetical protein
MFMLRQRYDIQKSARPRKPPTDYSEPTAERINPPRSSGIKV